jgi:hypothetical protein
VTRAAESVKEAAEKLRPKEGSVTLESRGKSVTLHADGRTETKGLTGKAEPGSVVDAMVEGVGAVAGNEPAPSDDDDTPKRNAVYVPTKLKGLCTDEGVLARELEAADHAIDAARALVKAVEDVARVPVSAVITLPNELTNGLTSDETATILQLVEQGWRQGREEAAELLRTALSAYRDSKGGQPQPTPSSSTSRPGRAAPRPRW